MLLPMNKYAVANKLELILKYKMTQQEALALKVALLWEEIIVKEGRVLNPSFTDYLLPTTLDAPDVIARLVEEPDPQAPLGAKGVGEPPCISVTPAIVAAIRDAVGRNIPRCPVRPQDICL